MNKPTPILLSVILLLIASLACTVPNITLTSPTPDQNFFNTAIAGTVSAALTQGAPTITPIPLVTDTPAFTLTPEPPTPTPTVTVTPSPIFTPTPLVPLISVSVDTNCRVGPGKIYDRRGALLVGEVVQVYGRDPGGNYWLIQNPDNSSEFCWVWGEYATLLGNWAAVPIMTPPPTPTPAPSFEATYIGKDTCVGWWLDFDLENTGGITFKSFSITVRDTVSDVVVSLYQDGFTDNSGCLDSVTRDNLNPGSIRRISSPAFNYDPAGHRLRATITVCSNLAQNGTCVTEVIAFTP